MDGPRAPLAGRLLALLAALQLPVGAVGLAGDEGGTLLPVAAVFALFAVGPVRLFLRAERPLGQFRTWAVVEALLFLVGGLLLLLAGGVVLWPTGITLLAAALQPRDAAHPLLRAVGALGGAAVAALGADVLFAAF